MKLRCLIIDDEPLVRDLLYDHACMIPYLEVVKLCSNALEVLSIIQQEEIDLLFLDVQMPKLKGTQMLEALPDPPLVIMVTAYEKYAVESFNLQVADYIVKPFSFERFLKACNRAAELYTLKNLRATFVPTEEHIFVNVEYTNVKINLADILYIEGLKDYIKIYLQTRDHPVITRMSQKLIESKLPHSFFIRTHKSFLVVRSKITMIKRDFVCIDHREIPVGETFKENIAALLTNRVT